MKKLNFFPYYEPYLRTKAKTTTFRVSIQQPFEKGEKVAVTIGWEEDNSVMVGVALIREIYSRRIKDLQSYDFDGESPDCRTREVTRLVLGSIYRSVLNDEDKVWVVKFDHLDKPRVDALCSP